VQEKERPLSRQTAVGDFLKSSAATLASPPVLSDTEVDDQMTRLQFKTKCLLLQLLFVCHFVFFVNFSYIREFFSVKIDWNYPSQFNIVFMGKSVSTYVVSTKVAGLGTIYDVTSGDECVTHSLGAFSGATSDSLHAVTR
jgi:hypothetical protein